MRKFGTYTTAVSVTLIKTRSQVEVRPYLIGYNGVNESQISFILGHDIQKPAVELCGQELEGGLDLLEVVLAYSRTRNIVSGERQDTRPSSHGPSYMYLQRSTECRSEYSRRYDLLLLLRHQSRGLADLPREYSET